MRTLEVDVELTAVDAADSVDSVDVVDVVDAVDAVDTVVVGAAVMMTSTVLLATVEEADVDFGVD